MQALVTTSSPPVWKFHDSSDIVAELNPRQRPSSDDVTKYNMHETLEKDIDADWSIPSGGSYFFPQASGPLAYDKIYRGIVSTEGFKAHDPNADFGNSMYNHTATGSWLVPAQPPITRLEWAARPQTHDQPAIQHLDWFRGHSYSHGVTPFADGKDEESTSGDINFHYALTLFGRATNNHELANVGSLMLRLNARVVKTYSVMTNVNRAQPTNFRGNKVKGILFDNIAD
ncbi:TPA: hypothetical protein N0F65_006647 [Lagenidium giganteum]|uniref:glucan endo-1,3-beta-D-glucosidase n=1 Tax=Lagenidium giganteum TaxID=4803 RepID=A0AAV2Z811_9STRA|nr:TPA: hypothetical protein N0F65_006647 [Lagenidium giganteum]